MSDRLKKLIENFRFLPIKQISLVALPLILIAAGAMVLSRQPKTETHYLMKAHWFIDGKMIFSSKLLTKEGEVSTVGESRGSSTNKLSIFLKEANLSSGEDNIKLVLQYCQKNQKDVVSASRPCEVYEKVQLEGASKSIVQKDFHNGYAKIYIEPIELKETLGKKLVSTRL